MILVDHGCFFLFAFTWVELRSLDSQEGQEFNNENEHILNILPGIRHYVYSLFVCFVTTLRLHIIRDEDTKIQRS